MMQLLLLMDSIDNHLVYLYADDAYAKQKEEELIRHGAEPVAYLTGKYEGYYNANDVNKVKSSSKVRVRTINPTNTTTNYYSK